MIFCRAVRHDPESRSKKCREKTSPPLDLDINSYLSQVSCLLWDEFRYVNANDVIVLLQKGTFQ